MIVSIKSAGKLKGTKISAPLCTLSDAMQIELLMFAAIYRAIRGRKTKLELSENISIHT